MTDPAAVRVVQYVPPFAYPPEIVEMLRRYPGAVVAVAGSADLSPVFRLAEAAERWAEPFARAFYRAATKTRRKPR